VFFYKGFFISGLILPAYSDNFLETNWDRLPNSGAESIDFFSVGGKKIALLVKAKMTNFFLRGEVKFWRNKNFFLIEHLMIFAVLSKFFY